MADIKPEDLTLTSLVLALGNIPREIEEQIGRWIDKGKSTVNDNLQITDNPKLVQIVFEKYAPIIQQRYQRVTELYQEFERRLAEYQANQKKP